MKTKIKTLLLTIASFLFAVNAANAQWNLTGNAATNPPTNFLGTTDGQPLVFKTNSTEWMRILTTGNVGIGTTSPGNKLHVVGNVTFDGSGSAVEQVWKGGTWFHAKADASNTFNIFEDGYETTRNIVLKAGTGYVGIGTTSPFEKLHLHSGTGDGDTYNTVFALSRTSSTGNVEVAKLVLDDMDTNYGNLVFKVKTTASSSESAGYYTDAMTIKGNNGDIGIGTSTPGAKLEVAGQVKITGGTPGAGKILISDANGLASWSTVGANGGWSTTGNASTVDGTNFIGTTDDIPFNIRVNNQKAGRIDRALFNTFFGYQAGNANTTGYINTANGHQALYSNTTGYANTALGRVTLYTNTTGSANVACGESALQLNTTGNYNTATGRSALAANTTGSYNTAVNQALVLNTTGNYNTGVGFAALGINETGSYNTALGYQAEPAGNNYSNTMHLGAISENSAVSNAIFLSNPSCSYLWCRVNLTVGSDKRIKDDIKENVPGLAFISKLRPVTYHYNIHRENEILGVKDDHNWDGKYDIEKMTMTGFIAQEVEQSANQIGYDFSGVSKPQNDKGIYGLRYAEFVVPLVKAVQEQQQMIDSLKAETANQNAINKSLQQQIDNLISNNSNHSNSINNSNAVNTNIDLNDKNVVVLEQNIPNPFAEQTIINYNLPDNFARAQIIFLDQSGKLIKAVDLNEKGRGILNVFASDLTNGMYTYSLIVDGQTMETKKMMKTK